MMRAWAIAATTLLIAAIAFAAWRAGQSAHVEQANAALQDQLSDARAKIGALEDEIAACKELMPITAADVPPLPAKFPRPDPSRLKLTIMTNAEIRGRLTRESLLRVIKADESRLRDCYADALTMNPEERGRIAVKWIVAPEGWVQVAAMAASTLDNAVLEQCIVNVVRTWKFPSPGTKIAVATQGFILEP